MERARGVLQSTFEVKPGHSSGAVTVASTPFPGAGISVLPSLTPMLSGKVSGSAEIVDRGLPTTAASDTIRGAFPRAPLTVAGRSHRPRKWARSNIPAPRGSGPTQQERAPALSNKRKVPDRTNEKQGESDTQTDRKSKEKPARQTQVPGSYISSVWVDMRSFALRLSKGGSLSSSPLTG